MRIVLGADHGGYELKEALKRVLAEKGIETEDLGCHSVDPVDYPDYSRKVALRISHDPQADGILVCTTGIGMTMAANRYPRVRAALCTKPEMARAARTHNNANVLVLAGRMLAIEENLAILDEWLANSFSGAERHRRRIDKFATDARRAGEIEEIFPVDPEIYEAIRADMDRQAGKINMIASENYASPAVREAQGSVLTNKYAEGYPAKRWYNGCECVDRAEQLAIDRAKALFGADHANVQPHSGSAANMAVYFAILTPGDTILAMSLSHGGHLTHGHKINFSGRFFNIVSYGVERETGQIDYDELARLAGEHKPRLIVAGASAYPRVLDFERFRKIADSVAALLMVDMAHIGGLVAAGCHPSPVPYAEFVTTTTHKTLRGPRGGMILCREEFAADIDRQIFPGIQGGPQMHTIAAKAVCLHEALQPEFKAYGEQIVRNAAVLAETLDAQGLKIVSGGTDNHLMLVDLVPQGITGRDAANALDPAGIIANKNTIPFDQQSPFNTSGIRLGTPAITTRGMKEPEMEILGKLIAGVLLAPDNDSVQKKTLAAVTELAAAFPVP